jgi:HicB family
MRQSNFALRLQPSLIDELRVAAKAEGVAVNQLINVAVAEKLATLRAEAVFRERSSKANRGEALRILERLGADEAPIAGDEVIEPRKKQVRRRVAEKKSGKVTARANRL